MGGILVTGANGQLGSELKKHFDLKGKLYSSNAPVANTDTDTAQTLKSIFYTDIADLDICNIDDVRKYIIDNKIEVIINCAAYTAVDRAEDDLNVAHKVNGEAPGILATVAAETGALLIHISTDYVFSGKGPLPYKEADLTGPVSVYGRTKLAGEYALAASGCRYVIVRTSWLYSIYGGNFVKTILRLASERETLSVVFDQIGTPTNAADLALAIGAIIEQAKEKNKINTTYHFSNEGVCSWYDFALEIVEFSGLKCKVIPVTSEMFPTKAKRPAFSVLNKGKIKSAFGIDIPHWKSSLHDCLVLMNKEI